MGLVVLIVVLNLFPYSSNLSFMPNGHVADVKYLVGFFQRSKFIYIHWVHSTMNRFQYI